MNPILRQFLSESRDFLEGIAARLMELEDAPADKHLMGDLFRRVHTLKGNTGLFDFPEMTRVLHAAEDLMVVVRDGEVSFGPQLADRLLNAMDFVTVLLDEIETDGEIGAGHGNVSASLAASLRQLIPVPAGGASTDSEHAVQGAPMQAEACRLLASAKLAAVPEELRQAWYREIKTGATLSLIRYAPEPECFFKGEDPFHQARQVPGLAWQTIGTTEPWQPRESLDPYRCILSFDLLSFAAQQELEEHFRYVREQVVLAPVPALALVVPVGDENGGPVYEDFVREALQLVDKGDAEAVQRLASAMLELSGPGLWLASALRWLLLVLEHEPENHGAQRILIEALRSFAVPDWAALAESAQAAEGSITQAAMTATPPAPVGAECAVDRLLSAQMQVLQLPDSAGWLPGRLRAVAAALTACCHSRRQADVVAGIDAALQAGLEEASGGPLRAWLTHYLAQAGKADVGLPAGMSAAGSSIGCVETQPVPSTVAACEPAAPDESDVKFGRRAEDSAGGVKVLKVDQAKVDRLMSLIGEMVVAKNALPYLAARAEDVFGVRDLAREIKAQYAVINRISEEMQDAIMQVRMMPVSFIFQRFPRLVRDISRRLGKEVALVLEGEDTEADKNIIEALADPLIHIVRNSLDHGIEAPQERQTSGKPACGRLCIRAAQEADRVVIEIEDDGRGIDPARVKRKAYEKGLLDEAALERLSDQEAINLVFAAGFSTAEVVSDLSGRGVGMDVVRAAVERVNGTLSLESRVGKGTCLRLSLPLSMAVTKVMIVESDNQIFGVPMDVVVETVRVPRSAVHMIKNSQATVLRGRIVPLRPLNELLATGEPQQASEDGELATLVVRAQGEQVGVVVDNFREVADIILKPMTGILGGLPGYAGSALLGDGSVLMVLSPKELV